MFVYYIVYQSDRTAENRHATNDVIGLRPVFDSLQCASIHDGHVIQFETVLRAQSFTDIANGGIDTVVAGEGTTFE